MTEKARLEIRDRLVLPAFKNGMSDSKWQRIAESIAKKHGITVEDVYYEDEMMFAILCEPIVRKAKEGLKYD